jgi:hypothetical protein
MQSTVTMKSRLPLKLAWFLVNSPKRALTHVLEWLDLHKSELLEDWELAKQRQPLKKVTPLE